MLNINLATPIYGTAASGINFFENDTAYQKMFPSVEAWVAAGKPYCIVIDVCFVDHLGNSVMIGQDAAYGRYYCFHRKPTDTQWVPYSFNHNDCMMFADLIVSYNGTDYIVGYTTEFKYEKLTVFDFMPDSTTESAVSGS